jgi:hypothetical protein
VSASCARRMYRAENSNASCAHKSRSPACLAPCNVGKSLLNHSGRRDRRLTRACCARQSIPCRQVTRKTNGIQPGHAVSTAFPKGFGRARPGLRQVCRRLSKTCTPKIILRAAVMTAQISLQLFPMQLFMSCDEMNLDMSNRDLQKDCGNRRGSEALFR